MEKFEQLIAHLPRRHQATLIWYFERTSRVNAWPDPIPTSNGLTHLATRAKGIYKPKWTKYALSVRQSLNSPYTDKEPITRPDGTWFYPYFQENTDPSARDNEFTNRALMNCWRDRVPIGVFRQTLGKPLPKYMILGVALVEGWEDGYFLLEGFSPDGCCRSRGFSDHVEIIASLDEG